jgi:hypothetical protein
MTPRALFAALCCALLAVLAQPAGAARLFGANRPAPLPQAQRAHPLPRAATPPRAFDLPHPRAACAASRATAPIAAAHASTDKGEVARKLEAAPRSAARRATAPRTDTARVGAPQVRARTWSAELAGFLQADEFRYWTPTGTLWSWPGQNPLRERDPGGRWSLAESSAVSSIVGILGNIAQELRGLSAFMRVFSSFELVSPAAAGASGEVGLVAPGSVLVGAQAGGVTGSAAAALGAEGVAVFPTYYAKWAAVTGLLATAATADAPESETSDSDCDLQYERDNETCRGLANPAARSRCFASATERWGACKHRTFIPPLISW